MFAKGKSGNPRGRPTGARNKASLMLDKLMERGAQDIVETVIDRAYHSRQADLMEFQRAWRAFKNSNSGRYRAAILAHSAILKATDAVKDAWPVERLAEAAVALREADSYAQRCPLVGVREFLSARHEHA